MSRKNPFSRKGNRRLVKEFGRLQSNLYGAHTDPELYGERGRAGGRFDKFKPKPQPRYSSPSNPDDSLEL